MNCLGTRMKNQLTESVRVYLFFCNSIPIIYMSHLIPVAHCVVVLITSFLVSYEIMKYEFSKTVFQDFLAILGPLNFHVNFRTNLSESAKKLVVFCWGLH